MKFKKARLLALAMLTVSSLAHAEEAKLAEAKITFNTYDGGNDKDPDSKLKIQRFLI
jgi:hypothetical protein